MKAKTRKVCLTGTILVMTITVAPLLTQETSRGQERTFPTAQAVSRQWLTRHPHPRDMVEKQIITVMDDHFKAITENRDLETVFVDASRWGMCITRKMQ